MSDPPWWPHECQDTESCARHKRCGYFGCRHADRYIGAEIEIARLRLVIRAAHDDLADNDVAGAEAILRTAVKSAKQD